MRRRNRKHRKPAYETLNRTIVTKGTNSNNMLRNTAPIRPYLYTKISEPISNCQFNIIIENNRNRKTEKRKENGKRKHNKKGSNSNWYESNFLVSFPSFPSKKMSSIAFFVPLKDRICDLDKNDDFENLMDWNSLLFYESNSSSMISQYDVSRKNNTQDKSVVSQFRKSRSSSESSITSEDSFICFEIDDYTEEDTNYPEKTEDYSSEVSNVPSDSKKSGKKKVRFAENSELVKVHVIVAWNFAYRAARISPWEVIARDANRFKLKIHSIEPIISPVLDPEHRLKVWHSRMEKFYK